MDLIAAGVTKGLGVKGCTIGLLDKKRDQLKVVAYQGLTQKYLEKGPIDPARSLSGMVQSGQDLYIQDVTKDTRVQYPEEAREEGIKSILSVPLLVKQESNPGRSEFIRAPPTNFPRRNSSSFF